MTPAIHVRLAVEGDLPALPAIERRAGERFRALGVQEAMLADVTTPEELASAFRAGLLWVAHVSATSTGPGGEIVGFAYCETLGKDLLLGELDVVPEYGRRGIGASLVRQVCAAGRDRGYGAVILTTFRRVPWNAPFYARMGFVWLPRGAWSTEVGELVAQEEAAGLRAADRIVMRFALADD